MIFICLIFIILISISAVSAEYNNTVINAINNNVNDNVLSVNDDNILNEQDSGSFSDLDTKINSGSSTEIVLENDYNYTAAYNSGNGVTISKSNVVIDGNGHTIDGNGQSRIFYITASGVTLKNINFINGYATHGGVAYFNQVVSIINCTFKNSISTGTSSPSYGGGALYGSNVGATIENCTFENNVAYRNGGALCILQGSGQQTKLTDCKFINNHADSYYGGAIYIRNYDGAYPDVYSRCIFKDNTAAYGNDISTAVQGYGVFNLTDSIILNPTANSIYLYTSGTFYANNNWWGNTKENYNVKPTISSTASQYQPIMNNWYYLDMNINYKLNTSDIALNNLYDEENVQVIVDDACKLADLTFTLSAVNATVPQNVTVKNGKATIEYSRSQPTGLLTATYEDISISKEIVKPEGDFNVIQELIDEAASNNVELLRDYVYDIYWDTITDGIVITQDNLVIDGKGFKIDAKDKSRIFKITANNVTLKNIKFINGYSNYAGAVYYSGQNINILNCTFENNNVINTTASNGLGGAMYINPSAGCTIEDCTFIGNSASNRGGAVFLFTQTGSVNNLNRNIFMENNVLQAGGAIATNGQGTINISNSIFLNNTVYQVYSLSNYISLDYNWWGNTINDYDDWPSVATNADYDWYFLNMEINETEQTATITLNNYYDGSVSQVSNYNLPKVTFDVSGVNVNVQNKVTLDESGKATISYDPTGETGSLTISIEDITLTKNFNKLLGEFGELDELISTSTASLIELDKNYTFTNILDDDFVNGIKISRSNIVIDGKGHTIDAKGQSRIFYVTGNQVTLKNINFVNGKSNYAGAVYGYGDNLYLINCTFVNNTAATSAGGAVYWYPDSYSLAANCTFINNTAYYGGAICVREYQSGITSEIVNCTFINNKATSTYGGGAIYDYSENWQAEVYITGCVFLDNAASQGSAIEGYIAHTYISDCIFLGNEGTAVYADGSYTYVDYNWWGNTYDTRTVAPSVNNRGIFTNWLYLDVIPNLADGTVTISINNVFDNETQTTSTYSTTALPPITVNLSAVNATLEANSVTLDNTGKGVVGYELSSDATITATFGEISQTKAIDYGSFNKLQKLITDAPDNSVITLTRDYVWGMGDTIRQGIVVYNKKNLTIDGNGHIVDCAGESRGFVVNVGSSDIVFKNIIIQNGKYNGDTNQDYGAGMILEAENSKLINCTFKDNYADGTRGGGALYILGENAYITDCTFVNNTHDNAMGGAINVQASGVNIVNTVFENNTADSLQGGAGAVYLGQAANIVNCTFNNNTAKYGGAIYDGSYDGITSNITDSTFTGNVATTENVDYGGGAIYSNKVAISDSVFIGNKAKSGAAIYNLDNSSSVEKCVFINNTGYDVIFWINKGSISNSIFLNNDVSSRIISNVWAEVKVEDNWFGNVWNNYNSVPDVTNLANMTNWIFLNATDLDYDFDSDTLTVKFKLFAYDPDTDTFSEFDFNDLPLFNLTITGENVTFSENTVGIGEQLSGTASYKGAIVAQYENVRYTVPFKYQQVSWIEVDPVFNLTVGDKNIDLSDDIRPWEDDYQPFLREPYAHGVVTYSSSNTSVVTVNEKGRVTAVSEGVANITIIYNGCDMNGNDRCLPCNATVLINVSRLATHVNFIYEPPTILYVGESGNIYASIYDAKNKSVSGASVTYTNNNPDVLSLTGNSYSALSEGIANITLSYAGNNKYLPCSYDLIIEISRRTPTISIETDYIEMNVSKIHYVGVSIYPSNLGLTASSNDTSVAISDNSGQITAVGVGIANITFRFEGNANYKPAEVSVIVNVTDVKTHIQVSQDEFNLNLTDSVYITASVRDSNDELVSYYILFTSNDTNVASVDASGGIQALGEGIANITLTFPGKEEYGPSTANVIVIVKKVQTEINVNDTISMFTGERKNMGASLNYPEAGTLIYEYEGDNIVVDSRGNIAAISEGIATVTITCAVSSEKYAPSNKTVIVNVSRRATEINLSKDIFDLGVSDTENINATLIPNDIGVLKYSSNDTDVAIVDQFGNIIAKGEGTANITIYYEGDDDYLPSSSNVIVNVVRKESQINVSDSISIYVDENKALDISSLPDDAALTFTSSDESIVTVDETGKLTGIKLGKANITINFAGSNEYLPSNATVSVEVILTPTEIIVDKTYGLKLDSDGNINATLSPAEAGSLTYTSSDENVVTVDEFGNLTTVSAGNSNITITFAGDEKYAPCSATVLVSVYRLEIPTEISVNDTIEVHVGDQINIGAELIPNNAGTLIYATTDSNIVAVDENGNIHALKVGTANITINFIGDDKFNASNATVKIIVSQIPTEIIADETTVTLNLTENTTANVSLNPVEAGSLTYTSGNESVATVDENGLIIAKGVGSTTITVSYAGNENYTAADDVVITVNVVTVATEITVNSTEISLYVDDTVNINATLNYPEAGDLIYTSSDDNVVTVDSTGKLIAIGEGEANITIKFEADGKYLASNKTVKVVVSKIPTNISVDKDSLAINLTDSAAIIAGLNPVDAGSLTYTSSNSSVVTVDDNGVITTVGEGEANITVAFGGNDKYLASNKTVKVVVSKVATNITVDKDSITMNLTDSATIVATLSPVDAGSLTYTSSNSSVVTVDDNGVLAAVGEGSAVITIKFIETEKYLPSEATVNVVVTTVATEISVDSTEISLNVDDTVNVNATLNYPEAGSLTYTSSDESVVTVDDTGKLIAIGEGEANITVKFEANGKYLASNKTVKVTVSRLVPEINVNKNVFELFVDDEDNLIAELIGPQTGDLIYDTSNDTVVAVDSNGKIIAKHEGKANITITFLGDNKYSPAEMNVTVIVSRHSTSIEVNDTINLEIGEGQQIHARLNPSVGTLTYTSSNPAIVEAQEGGFIASTGFGSATITVSYAGNDKYAPSNATITVSVKGRQTEIAVKDNLTLTVEDTAKLDAVLVFSKYGQNDTTASFRYTSSNPNIVSVDNNGQVVAHKAGNVVITINYDGLVAGESIVNYPCEAKVNITVNPKASEISVDTEVTLEVDQNTIINATTVSPKDGELTFTSANESIAVVDANGKITAIGKGTTTITVKYVGNDDYLPSSKEITVTVTPIPTEITVNGTFTVYPGEVIDLGAILTPNVGQLEYINNMPGVVSVDSTGKVTGESEGSARVTVRYAGDSRYAEASEDIIVNVVCISTSISVNKNLELSIGDSTNLNAKLNPQEAGTLTYKSGDESIVTVDGTGNVIAVGEGSTTITVKFTGNGKYSSATAVVNVTVTKNTKSVDLDVSVSDTGSTVFSANLPKDATGSFTVIVDGKEVETKALKDGSASIEVSGLSSGNHKVTLVYSGDSKYGKVTKTTTIRVPEIKLDKNTDIVMLYTAGNKYTVHLTKDTKAMAGKTIVFTINGKKVYAKTDAKGYASVKINLPPRAKAYDVTASFAGKTVKNTVKVKSIIKAKNIKAKKSAKKLKIKVALKKVNGKYLKGKKIKLKFKGKKYKAKTNKKGKAKFTIKKKVLKKLKVGKKYKYKVTFKKDKVTKKIKIKK